jgi:quercetin dioxygenase-like cupin family protein
VALEGMNMKMNLCIAFAFVLGILTGRVTTPVSYSQLRTVNSTPLLTTDLAGWCDGKEVTVELNQIDPGKSGKHYHPAHSFTYVLEGAETYAVEGQASRTIRVGDVVHEAPMQVHTVSNSAPVKLLVIRIIEKGKEATVRLP